MSETFRIRLQKEQLVFSAAHFITFAGDICERLHGHNYGVAVEIAGPLDENRYVIDFIALRDELQSIVVELDHRMLLPTDHPLIHVEVTNREVIARFRERRWVFPEDDCAILPIANTTAELLAQYLAQRLCDRLETHRGIQVTWIRMEVDENHGQWGIYEMRKP